MAILGTGTTFAFGSANSQDAFAGKVINVEFGSVERVAIDCTHLGTTNQMEYIPATLVDPGEVSLEFYLDPEQPLPPIMDWGASSGFTANDEQSGTLTITFPKQTSTNSTAASLEGTAFITSFEITSTTEEKVTGNVTFKFDGQTELAFTQEAA